MSGWQFVEGQKRHTQDGCQLALLMKSVGHGRRPVFAIDVGCGDGIIAFEMLRLKRATRILAFDILKEATTAAEHNLAEAIDMGIVEVRRASARSLFNERKLSDVFDRFVINPPFFASGSGHANKNKTDQLARHDISLNLKVWAKGARKLLKTGGELYCVFPTERLSECLSELSKNQVEPKEIWWLKHDKRKRRFFLRAVRGAKKGLIAHFDHEM